MRTRTEWERFAREVTAILAGIGPGCAASPSPPAGPAVTATGAAREGGDGVASAKVERFPCRDPRPVLRNGAPTGFVECAGGWTHRTAPAACPPPAPSAEAACSGGCSKDADCAEKPHGRCRVLQVLGGATMCTCAYACETDADCGAAEVCACGDDGGRCVPSDCRAPNACGTGLCASAVTKPTCGTALYQCQRPEDACMTDADCPAGEVCVTGAGGPRQCRPREACAIPGRPFLVEGEARIAPVVASTAWLDPSLVLPGRPPDEASRAGLAAYFARAAQFEHASIAAFARFTLELMAFGAPPDLVDAAREAMADETRHARLCFTLASHYAGRPLGPGSLDLTGRLAATSLEEAVEATVLEGCLGETLAAIEAAVAASTVEDPALAAVLARIADDERRHAELAWRFVAWAVRAGSPAVRTRAAAALEARMRALHAESSAEDAVLEAAGLPNGPARDRCLRSGAETLVRPALKLLAG